MKRIIFRLAFCGLLVLVCGAGDWPGFRGPGGTSVSDQTDLPKTFGDDENVAWKTPLPGPGPGGPIVVGKRVVVTAASGTGQSVLHVLAFDTDSGEPVWHRRLWATGSNLFHDFGGMAANTAASDGESIFAFFSSGDLACFDLDGNLRWFRGLGNDYPTARNDVGMGSSPLVVGQTVIVQMECQGDSFAAGLDTATGTTRWRIPRERDAVWSSPTLLPGGEGKADMVLMHSRSRLTALAPDTGKELWDFETECHTTASVTTCDGVVYLPANGLNALRPKPAGGVELLWYEQKLRSGPASPIVHAGRAYTLKSPGILVCGDAADGDVLWQLRLKGPFWATAVLADGHLYAVNHDGLAHVVKLGETAGELVASCQLDPKFLASPAVADGAIYFRGSEHLWKVASK